MDRTRNYRYVEFPDEGYTIEFAGLCTVRLEIVSPRGDDPKKIGVTITGHDDRTTIMMDEVIEIPAAADEDEDHNEEEDKPDAQEKV